MACTSYGQLGCDGNCSKAFDGTPGSCPQAGAAEGQVGGACAGWPSPACASNGRCIDGTCIACGGNGGVCCDPPLETPNCNSGTCVSNGDYGQCSSSCGQLGQGCCPGDGTECSTGVCDNDTKKCVQPMQSQSCNTGTQFSVWIVDSAGCAVEQFHFAADNETDAQTCANAVLVSFGGQGNTLSQLDADVDPVSVCEASLNGNFLQEINVVDPAKLSSCEQEKCGNCTFTTPQADDTCPFQI